MRERLESIYREHRQGLFSLALSITRRRDAAEDAVHDAFARLFRSRAVLQGDAVAYVFACVRNAAVDVARRRPPEAALSESLFEADCRTPADAAESGEQTDRLRQALGALPGPQRETVVMRTYAGLTFQQIAEALGEPLPTVASRYRRALERIRRFLGEGD